VIHRLKFLILLIVILLSACSTKMMPQIIELDSTSESGEVENSDLTTTLVANAERTLNGFHQYLNQGEYELALEHYGGTYDVLQGYNPAIDHEDKANLLRAACEFNGFMCLGVREMTFKEAINPHEFIFTVEFANPDGTLFVLGPCCGADEETMPPQSSFMVQVNCQEDGSCLVMDLPPYVP